MTDLNEEAVKGAAVVLDGLVPGWATKVDVDRLDFESETDCVLGQLYGHAWQAPIATFRHPALAFIGRWVRPMWISEITKRRAA